LVLQYRECARHVWNTYFRQLKGDQHGFIESFDDVNAALFRGLVLQQIVAEGQDSAGGCLKVVPQLPSQGFLPVMYAKQAEDGNWYWKEEKLKDGKGEFEFVEFFDFCGPRDVRDFRYVRVKIIKVMGQPDMNEANLLIEPEYVQFLSDCASQA
jgi:hypothetical protein